MDPESLLRERLGRAASDPLSGSLEERVLGRTTRRAAQPPSRVLAIGAALSTALVVGGVLYGVASLGRHSPEGSRTRQGGSPATPHPRGRLATPTPTPTPVPTPTPRPVRRLRRPVATARPPGAPSPAGSTGSATPPPAPTTAILGACIGRQLTITARAGPRSAATATVVYVLDNVGTSACTLRGVPAVRLVGAGGSPRPMVPVRDRRGPRRLVTVAPGGRASFVLRDLGCRQATAIVADATLALDVTLPGRSGGSPLLVQGGLLCGPTMVEVSAITAGIARPAVGPLAPAVSPARPSPTHVGAATPRPSPSVRVTAPPSVRRTPRPTPRPTPRTTPRPTPAVTPIPPPTPTPAPIPLCTTADLQFSLFSGPISGQSTSVSLGLTDHTPAPCVLVGLPTVDLVTSDGATVPLGISSVSYNPSVELVLAANGQIGVGSSGAVVVLDLQWPASSLSCAAATGVSITPQYLGGTLTVHDVPIPVCTGAGNVTAQLQAFGS